MEDVMNKPLIAVATALSAATTMFASTAEAGFKVRLGFGGPLPAFTAYGAGSYAHKGCHNHDYRSVRYHEREEARVIKKTHKASVAKADETPDSKPETVSEAAQTENSSITTAPAEATIAAPETKTVAEAKEVGCKKFFPSVGMTLSVPCE
jgi:hypothetical protein